MLHRFAAFELDSDSFTLRCSGDLVDLPPKAVELLALLVQHSGHVVSKRELMDALWPHGFVEEANLTQHVYLLRRAFRKHGLENVIETAPRRGYRFNAPARHPSGARTAARMNVAAVAALAAAVLLFIVLYAVPPAPPSPHLSGKALHAYQLGRYFWNLRSMAGMKRGLAYFRQATALAPRSAIAYAGLADAYTELADFSAPCSECAGWQRNAERAAERALALDASSAEAHVAYGMVRRVFHNDDRTAVREFTRALALDPDNALANQWYGNMLVANGSAREGVRRLQIAAAEQPVSTSTYAWLARGYYYLRQYGDAAHYAHEALALEPTRLETAVVLGLADEGRGRYADAIRDFKRARRAGASQADSQALIASVEAAMGRRSRALRVLHHIAGQRLGLFEARDLVIALSVAGDTDGARKLLARIRYRTPLDRELLMQDPHIRMLQTLS